jgi:5'-3' exonuclease
MAAFFEERGMGVRGLLSYVKKRIPLIEPKQSDPVRIGVDVHGLLYTWQDDLESFTKFLHEFETHGHTLLFVFDGEAAEDKKDFLVQRRKRREQSALQAKAIEAFLESKEGYELDEPSRIHLQKEIISLRKAAWYISKEYRERILNLLRTRNIQCVLAKGEADEVLVSLAHTKEIDIVLSSDMDFVRFGINRMWIPCFKNSHFTCYDLDIPIFCDSEDIPIEGLKDVAQLCDTMTPGEAFGILRYYGSLDNFHKVRAPDASIHVEHESS